MNPIFRTINFTMKSILRSPLHKLVSGNLLLITVRGRKSGKRYTLPASYQREHDVIYIVSVRSDRWWRNLRDGAAVDVLVQRKRLKGHGYVVEDISGVELHLARFLQHAPMSANVLGVTRDAHGHFKPQDLRRAAEKSVVVYVELAHARNLVTDNMLTIDQAY